MAPIPEDNQERPPPEDGSDLSNPNLVTVTMDSDVSDEDSDNYPDTAGYMLLPQEPNGNGEDSDNDDMGYLHEDDVVNIAQTNAGDISAALNHCAISNRSAGEESVVSEVGASEAAASALPVSLHHEFLDKGPDGKVPAYMEVPSLPASTNDSLWNKKRAEKNTSTLNSAQESKILKAMSGFSIPSDNVPEWAKNMSDEQWHKYVVKKIKPDSQNSGQNGPETDSAADQNSQTVSSDSWVAEFPDS